MEPKRPKLEFDENFTEDEDFFMPEIITLGKEDALELQLFYTKLCEFNSKADLRSQENTDPEKTSKYICKLHNIMLNEHYGVNLNVNTEIFLWQIDDTEVFKLEKLCALKPPDFKELALSQFGYADTCATMEKIKERHNKKLEFFENRGTRCFICYEIRFDADFLVPNCGHLICKHCHNFRNNEDNGATTYQQFEIVAKRCNMCRQLITSTIRFYRQ